MTEQLSLELPGNTPQDSFDPSYEDAIGDAPSIDLEAVEERIAEEDEVAARGSLHKVDQATVLRIWRAYEALETCSPENVPNFRAAIAYLGGSLEYRWPIPAQFKRLIDEPIPVRKV